MQQKVESFIQKYQLLRLDKAVIVGVSGGTDSVVLLHLLVALGYKCVIAHCNFHLRREESDRDEIFVRKLAQDYNISSYFIDFETIEYAKEHKISIEMAARDLRYTWFEKLRVELNAQAVAVAHHADDGIETLLLNLIRGTGIRGLKGISKRNKNIVRPLLFLSREEIEKYLNLYNLEHVEDSTNAGIDYKRNKIRNEILPLLEEINPSVRQTLYNNLQHFEGNLAIYEQAINNIEKKIVRKANDIIRMNISLILQQADVPTIMYELLYPYGFSPSVIEQITSQLRAESGKTFYSEFYILIKDRNELIISIKQDIAQNDIFITQHEKNIQIPVKMNIKRIKIDENFGISKNRYKIHVDAAKLNFPLCIRRWKEGDSFMPFGMLQHKKVSDFLINNKCSLIDKEHVYVLISDERIVWIIGWRMDNRYKVTNQTTEVYEFQVNDLV